MNSDLASGLKQILRSKLGDTAIDNWFKGIRLEMYDTNVKILLPNQFIRDWVSTHYIDDIYEAMKALTKLQHLYLCFDLDPQAIDREPIDIATLESSQPQDLTIHTFDNFVVGRTNEMAYTAAMKVCENVPYSLFNPLFLYGEPGVGKSHLLSAILNQARKNNPELKIYYMTAEKFMYTFIKALRDNSVMNFKDELRDANLFLLDDVQFMMGKGSTQEEFFHTFNFLKSNRCQIVLSSDKSPNQLEQLAGRLRSRLGGGLTIEIHQPDYELRLSILMNKAEGSQIEREVLEYLAGNVQGNVRDLEGSWTRLTAYSQWMKEPISIELIHKVLKDNLAQPHKKITIQEIQLYVCSFYGLELSDIRSDKREKRITRARHVAMMLTRELTNLSSNDIGREFGGKDHSSVLYAIEKMNREQHSDFNLASEINQIKQKLTEQFDS